MASRRIPSTMKQVMVKTKGTDFRKVTTVMEVPVPQPGQGEVLVKTKYVGINASDVNMTAGRYFSDVEPPFPAGFEGLGSIVQVGENSPLKEGQNIVYNKMGAFSEYVVIPEAQAIPVPSPDPAFISIGISGTTASISLEKEGNLKEGKTVLVTAAAGGTGQYAVQLAKLAGCHVIGTCSSDDKCEFLKSIGCDRPINYKKEDLNAVLKKEYPKGLDVVYESIGKEMFDTCLRNMAVNGVVIVIGMISGYHDDSGIQSGTTSNIPYICLSKSCRLAGFFLPHYTKDVPSHVMKLVQLYSQKKLKIGVDSGSEEKPLIGLESVADAVDYMYAGKNKGKLVVNVEGEKSSL